VALDRHAVGSADGRRPVDRLQVTLFPVITGKTGTDPLFRGAADFDLELIENRTLDGNIEELTYRPTLHA
jgi:hypothetical protein